jgi:hypothetical protein
MLFENLTSPTFMLFACITAGPKNGMVPLRGTIPISGSPQHAVGVNDGTRPIS